MSSCHAARGFFKLVSDWAIPKWKYRSPFDLDSEDHVTFYTYIAQKDYERAERYNFKLTIKRDISFNYFIPEFAIDKKLGFGDDSITIQEVFENGINRKWGLNTNRVCHKGDVLNLEAIVKGDFKAESCWKGFFRVRMSSDDDRSIQTAPDYIRSSPVRATVHELDENKS